MIIVDFLWLGLHFYIFCYELMFFWINLIPSEVYCLEFLMFVCLMFLQVYFRTEKHPAHWSSLNILVTVVDFLIKPAS